jgi:hypothetical protein
MVIRKDTFSVILNSPISGSNNLTYYKVMVFTAHMSLTQALNLYHILNKTPMQSFTIVVLILFGLNAWIEGIIMFFAITLNLTVLELRKPDSFDYLKPIKDVETKIDYK